jgi:hypothetical protein
MFRGRELGFVNILEIEKKMAVIITANSTIVEKDIQDAKRVLRFSRPLWDSSNREYKMVMVVNIDWYGKTTYEFVSCDECF